MSPAPDERDRIRAAMDRASANAPAPPKLKTDTRHHYPAQEHDRQQACADLQDAVARLDVELVAWR